MFDFSVTLIKLSCWLFVLILYLIECILFAHVLCLKTAKYLKKKNLLNSK